MPLEEKTFTIGADPEFAMSTEDGYPIGSYSFFQQHAAVGCDGHSFTGELRPYRGVDSLELVSNIATILNEAAEQNPGLKNIMMLSGHYKCGVTIGGHIHIGGAIKRYDPSVFAEYVEPCLNVLSDHIDELDERSKRRSTGYGAGSRTKPHGIELRSPGSWLLSPSTAFANLYLAEVMAKGYVAAKAGETSWSVWRSRAIAGRESIDHLMKMVEEMGAGGGMAKTWLKTMDGVMGAAPLNWYNDLKDNGWMQ